MISTHEKARLLAESHCAGSRLPSGAILPRDRGEAFAIQDATLALVGEVGGWKVGAASAHAEPICAPLPKAYIHASGAILAGKLRGVEVELAFRTGRDLHAGDASLDDRDLLDLFDAILPVIELVESRLEDWETADPLSRLADLQSHGALIIGRPLPFKASEISLPSMEATLTVDGQEIVSTKGGNPAGDLTRLLRWLINNTVYRGGLPKGMVITTGSYTGIKFVGSTSAVLGSVAGLGGVRLNLCSTCP
jgi:2-keto-4-pentenoate hydratase